MAEAGAHLAWKLVSQEEVLGSVDPSRGKGAG